MNISSRFGASVKARRIALKLSQEELAYQCGTHRTYISGIETGRRNPSLAVVDAIAQALGVTPATLLSEEGAG